MIKNSAPGPDQIPAWVLRACSVELAEPVSELFRASLRYGIIPNLWHHAVVTPVPKVPKPTSLTDYRPISVTSLLSRTIESIIVKRYLQPALLRSAYSSSQFAFCPTGSAESALIVLFHKVSLLLETNSYVRCLLVDFSKAFDIVDRHILASKLTLLQLPYFVIAWVLAFLSYRTQSVMLNGELSTPSSVNCGGRSRICLRPCPFLNSNRRFGTCLPD